MEMTELAFRNWLRGLYAEQLCNKMDRTRGFVLPIKSMPRIAAEELNDYVHQHGWHITQEGLANMLGIDKRTLQNYGIYADTGLTNDSTGAHVQKNNE